MTHDWNTQYVRIFKIQSREVSLELEPTTLVTQNKQRDWCAHHERLMVTNLTRIKAHLFASATLSGPNNNTTKQCRYLNIVIEKGQMCMSFSCSLSIRVDLHRRHVMIMSKSTIRSCRVAQTLWFGFNFEYCWIKQKSHQQEPSSCAALLAP